MCRRTYVYASMYKHAYACTEAWIHAYGDRRTNVNVFIRVYIYIYIYSIYLTHTYIYIYIYSHNFAYVSRVPA